MTERKRLSWSVYTSQKYPGCFSFAKKKTINVFFKTPYQPRGVGPSKYDVVGVGRGWLVTHLERKRLLHRLTAMSHDNPSKETRNWINQQ